MPRYQEQADYLIEQLAKIRQSLSFLNEQLKQVSSLGDRGYIVIN